MIRRTIKIIRKLSKTKKAILYLLSVVIIDDILLLLFGFKEDVAQFSTGFGLSLSIILYPIFFSKNY